MGPQYRRLWCVAAALITWNGASSLWEAGNTPTQWSATAIMLVTWVAGFALLLLAALPSPPQRLASITALCAMGLVTLCFVANHRTAQLEHGPMTTDVHLYMDYAARVLRDGVNPYSVDLLESFRLNRVTLTYATPLLDGDLTGRLAYPALSFLMLVPFQLIGFPTQWTYLLVLLAGLAVLYGWAPKQWRPVVLLPFFIDPRFVLFSLGTVNDCVWAVLLALMAAYWDRPRVRAVALGLAMAIKQQPWVLAPLLLIRLWNDTQGGRKERLNAIGQFVGLAAAVFLALNLPFIVWSPTDWVAGTLEPVLAPMITFGQGLSALTMAGLLTVPKWGFSVLMGGTYVLSAWLLHRYHRWARAAIWLIPGFALWLGNRSLSSYWYYFLFPLVVDLLAGRRADLPAPPPARLRALWAAVAALVLGVTAVLLGAALRDPGFRVEVEPTLWTEGDLVERVSLSVTNTTKRPLRPRFSVQSTSLQPYFWAIEAGPQSLAPNQTARYVIRARAPYHRFWVRHGARILVSSDEAFGFRASAFVPGDPRAAYRDDIPNPDFRLWDSSNHRPTYWGLVSAPSGLARTEPAQPSGPGAPAHGLWLEWPGSSQGDYFIAALDTYMVLPWDPIEVSVRVPPDANVLPELELVYGLRLLVRGKPLLVLFGDVEAQGEWADRGQYVMHRAPRGTWSTHRIDLQRELRELGIDVRPLVGSWAAATEWDYAVLPINLQLFLSGRAVGTPHRVTFGPVHTGAAQPKVTDLYQQSRAHPEVLEAWRGDWALAHRNYETARKHYEAAAALAPDVAVLRLRVAEALFWQGRWRAAAADYRATTELDPSEPMAFKGLGWCHFNVGEVEQAVSAWEQAVALFERRPTRGGPIDAADAIKGLAMAAAQLDQCAEAEAYLRKARTMAPTLELAPQAFAGCRLPAELLAP